MSPDPLGRLNVREAARLMGVHENTIRNWVHEGVLDAEYLPSSGFIRIPINQGGPMSAATEALSVVDAIAEGRYDRFLLSIHLAVAHRMADTKASVRQQVLEEFAEREKVR